VEPVTPIPWVISFTTYRVQVQLPGSGYESLTLKPGTVIDPDAFHPLSHTDEVVAYFALALLTELINGTHTQGGRLDVTAVLFPTLLWATESSATSKNTINRDDLKEGIAEYHCQERSTMHATMDSATSSFLTTSRSSQYESA